MRTNFYIIFLPGGDLASLNRRGLIIIMPMVYASFIFGFMATYQQDTGLFAVFSILNGILGGCIFIFHCSGNEEVRNKLNHFYMVITKQDQQ